MPPTHVGVTVSSRALARFGFAKYRFPGRTLLFLAVLSTIMVPVQVLVVPLFCRSEVGPAERKLRRSVDPRDDERQLGMF